MSNFAEQKNELLLLLSKHTNKLLFPQTLINSFSNIRVNKFIKLLLNYNNNLKKLRNLESELLNMTSWGIFFNSYYNWKNKIVTTIEYLNKYKNKIVNFVNNSNNISLLEYTNKNINKDTQEYIALRKTNINTKNIVTFFNISKVNGSYVYSSIIDNNKTIIFSKFHIQQIIPRCIIKDDNCIIYENIHELEEEDKL